jgi:hypothetical protein
VVGASSETSPQNRKTRKKQRWKFKCVHHIVGFYEKSITHFSKEKTIYPTFARAWSLEGKKGGQIMFVLLICDLRNLFYW